jgi:hypothetical protein
MYHSCSGNIVRFTAFKFVCWISWGCTGCSTNSGIEKRSQLTAKPSADQSPMALRPIPCVRTVCDLHTRMGSKLRTKVSQATCHLQELLLPCLSDVHGSCSCTKRFLLCLASIAKSKSWESGLCSHQVLLLSYRRQLRTFTTTIWRP